MQMMGGVHRSTAVVRWVLHGLQMLFGLALLLFPALIMMLLLLFLGCYLQIVGIWLVLKGLSLRFPSCHLPSTSIEPQSHLPYHFKQSGPSSPGCAIVFIRRAGATGLGHIGWGFGWRNGWFLVGSAENRGGKPFAKPEEMGFWSTLTQDPMTTMAHWNSAYDEDKLFFVASSHPKEAWKTLIWESQEPYAFVHHNCCDVAYEILHTYGCTEVLDPAWEYVPNDWYDALPGISSPLTEYPPAFLVSWPRRRQREIPLAIPARVKGVPPLWHSNLWRPWEELALMSEMMLGHIRTLLISHFKRISRQKRRDVSRS